MQCDCSICRKKGALLTSFVIAPEDMSISSVKDSLRTYEFGTLIAKHYFCGRCGIFPFVQTRLDPGKYRVNIGCLEEVDAFAIPVVLYDGQSL